MNTISRDDGDASPTLQKISARSDDILVEAEEAVPSKTRLRTENDEIKQQRDGKWQKTEEASGWEGVDKNVFKRFWRWLAEYKGPPSTLVMKPVQSFRNFADLLDAQFGTKLAFVTDQYFGSAMNLFKSELSKLKEGKNERTPDGWITRRRRETGHDWCVIQMGLPGTIYGFEVDFTGMGNDGALRMSIEGVNCLTLSKEQFVYPQVEEKLEWSHADIEKVDQAIEAALQQANTCWVELLDPEQASFVHTNTSPNKYCFLVKDSMLKSDFTHLRINLFPDGGIARLRAYGQPALRNNLPKLAKDNEILNIISPVNGGNLLLFDDSALLNGHPKSIIVDSSSKPSLWETTRKVNRPPIMYKSARIDTKNYRDWAIFKFHGRAILDRIHVNAKDCVGRIPLQIVIDVMDKAWIHKEDLLEEQQNFERDVFISRKAICSWNRLKELSFAPGMTAIDYNIKEEYPHWKSRCATHLKITLIPDGGISNLAVFGTFVK